MKLHTIAIAIFAIAAIAVATAAGAGNTTASFSDQVTSNANTFQAGTLQLDTSPSTAACAGRTYGGVPGNPGADTKTGCTAPAATFTGATGMIPTGTASATLTIQNIGTLNGTLSVGTPVWSVTTAGKGTCGAADLSVSATYSGQLAAGASHGIPVTVTVPATSQDGCQGATFTAGIPFEMNGASTTGFSDLLTSTGNTFTMGKLPAPTDLHADPNTGGTQVTFTWASASGDFATSWNVARQSGTSCTGWTPSPSDVVASGLANRSYVDTDVAAGSTYCYAAQGVSHNWLSPFSDTSSASPTAPAKDLYIHSDNTLGDNPDAGSWTLPKGSKGSPTIWTSETSNYVVGSGAAWVTDTWALSLPPGQYDGSGLTITLWMSPTAGTCTFSDSSSASNKIATATSDGPVSGAINLNPNTAFTARTGTICLGVAPHDNGHAQTFTSAGSYIQGPFQ